MFDMDTKTQPVRIFSAICLMAFFSCGSDGDSEPEPVGPEGTVITVNLADVKQEMIGFGGALTWYSNWVTNNNKKEEIADLMFDDLGIDIVRFKNWYYPSNYPVSKSTTTMPDDNAKAHWESTNKLYEMAKERNPDIKILFSSWGPPKALKSNNLLAQGTLKKDDNGFMYDAFATYWEDILDNVPFDPDYISIQNEPTFITPGWTSCQWAAAETSALPSYPVALDKVYDKIKTRDHVPVMLGPESQDISTFVSFANVIKTNPNVGLYGFHPYNVNSGTPSSTITSGLQSIGNFSTKPNLMTEFADNLDWYNTALYIHRSLVYANTSGYIYWKLAWDTPASGEDAGMISVNSDAASSGYEVTPFYYLIKHYAKHVDAGYHRVESTSPNAALNTTAFVSPDNKKLTLVIINTGTTSDDVNFAATGKTISSVSADQSKEGEYYKNLTVSSPTDVITLPAKSITTVVLNL